MWKWSFYEGRSINKLQNGVILLVFKIYKKNPKYTFCSELIREIYWIFFETDINIVTSLVLRTQSANVVFAHYFSFTTRQVLNSIVSYENKKLSWSW